MRIPLRFASLSPLRAALALTALVFAVPEAQAQICSGSITLTTQSEVDAFACAEVTGDLFINSGFADPITNLSDLSGLTSVGSSLTIRSNDALANLTGLEN